MSTGPFKYVIIPKNRNGFLLPFFPFFPSFHSSSLPPSIPPFLSSYLFLLSFLPLLLLLPSFFILYFLVSLCNPGQPLSWNPDPLPLPSQCLDYRPVTLSLAPKPIPYCPCVFFLSNIFFLPVPVNHSLWRSQNSCLSFLFILCALVIIHLDHICYISHFVYLLMFISKHIKMFCIFVDWVYRFPHCPYPVPSLLGERERMCKVRSCFLWLGQCN